MHLCPAFPASRLALLKRKLSGSFTAPDLVRGASGHRPNFCGVMDFGWEERTHSLRKINRLNMIQPGPGFGPTAT